MTTLPEPTPQDLSLWPFIEENAGLISLVALLVTGLLPALSLLLSRYQTSGLRSEIRDRASWAILVNRYTQTRRNGYFAGIKKVLDWADGFYGTRLLGRQAVGRCFQLSFVYPQLAYLVGWVAFDAGKLGGLALLPEDEWNLFSRAAHAVGLIGATLVQYVIFSSIYSDRESQKKALLLRLAPIQMALNWLAKHNSRTFATLSLIAPFLLITILFSYEIVGVFLFVSVCLIAFSIGSNGALGGTLMVICAIGSAVIFFGASINASVATLSAIFILLLPISNAVADTGSVAATRFFLRKIHGNEHSLPQIFGGVIVDLVVALLCLLGLGLAIIAVLSVWESVFPASLAFDWRSYWADIRQGDTGKATILILMLFTTLIPTLVHVAAGIAGFWASESRGWHRAVEKIQVAQQDYADPGTPIPEAWVNDRVRDIRDGIFWGWLRSLVLITVFGAVIFAVVYILI